MLYDITVAWWKNCHTFVLIDILNDRKQKIETKLSIHKRNISDIYVLDLCRESQLLKIINASSVFRLLIYAILMVHASLLIDDSLASVCLCVWMWVYWPKYFLFDSKMRLFSSHSNLSSRFKQSALWCEVIRYFRTASTFELHHVEKPIHSHFLWLNSLHFHFLVLYRKRPHTLATFVNENCFLICI